MTRSSPYQIHPISMDGTWCTDVPGFRFAPVADVTYLFCPARGCRCRRRFWNPQTSSEAHNYFPRDRARVYTSTAPPTPGTYHSRIFVLPILHELPTLARQIRVEQIRILKWKHPRIWRSRNDHPRHVRCCTHPSKMPSPDKGT